MNNGYSQINGAMLNGLLDISANSITTTVMDASQIVLNGFDITGSLTQVPINTSNITTLQQITTGITYNNVGSVDLTTIDNNLTITNTKKIKCVTVPTTNDDIVNKLYCDTAISNLVNSAPASLDTLNELALALGSDANFATTVTNSIATKASISGANNMSNVGNIFYGDGSHLTGLTSGTLTTTTIPATGTYYLPLVSSSIGASSQTPYVTNKVSVDVYNSIYYLPNISSNGALTFTANPTISSTGSLNLKFITSAVGSGIVLAPNNQQGVKIDTSAITNYLPAYFNNSITLPDATAPTTNYSKHSYTTTDYSIENAASSGTISFKTENSGGTATTPFQINSSNCTFTQPPLCSVLPTLNTHIGNKQYIDSMSDPIGTIVIYSSNTMPIGWLLCDGQSVSTTTYAGLFAVIGYTYTLVLPPATGFFFLPDFTGVYTRGKGTRAAMTTTTTTLGQVQSSSAGYHQHNMAAMSTDTQGTTGTVTVVSNVTGVGLALTHQVVSNGVVTTQSTSGTGKTTFTTFDGFGSVNDAENRPNAISMNYIIKYSGGSTTIITDPSFTQLTNALTIQNNYATSGITNFTLKDSTSTIQTPLSLASTTNTSFVPLNVQTSSSILGSNPALSITDSITNNVLKFLPNALPSAYNYITNSNDQLIFADGNSNTEYLTLTSHSSTCSGMRIGPSSVLLGAGGITTTPSNNIFCDTTNVSITSSNYINLNAISGTSLNGSYLYGRSDGASFNAIGPNALYPIGYTISYVPATIAFTSGIAQTFISPALAKGVWMISGWGELTRGTGTYLVTSYIRVIIDKTTAGQGNVTPTSVGSATRISIASTSTDATIQAPISCVCISLNDLCTVTMSVIVVMTVGTATICPRMSFTKIA